MSVRDGTKSTTLNLTVWFNQTTGHIHLAGKDLFISTVSDNPKSKRYHPNLYRKLARTLRDANKPHPNPSPEVEGLS